MDLSEYEHGFNYFVRSYLKTGVTLNRYWHSATLADIPNTKGPRMNSMIAKTLDLAQRLVSLFIASALPIITGGAILGVDVIKSAGVAGLTALFGVVQKLAAASVDGELTSEEISAAFGTKAKKK